jgi:hypothetical protein
MKIYFVDGSGIIAQNERAVDRFRKKYVDINFLLEYKTTMGNERVAGPTGEFLDGKIDKTDKGGIQIDFGIDQNHKLVIIQFGAPVRWLGLSCDDAISIAGILLEKAGVLGGPNDL